MGLKPDTWILRMAREEGMIEPFAAEQVREGVVSYGLSSYGYDMRVADEFRVLEPSPGSVLDPKATREEDWRVLRGECLLPSGALALARSVEYFRIPPDVLTLSTGKSTYARCGVLVNITPFEPGWEGYVTLAVTNMAPVPVRIHPGEGIAQVLFFQGDEPCAVSYADRKGKYQAQQDITPSRLDPETPEA